MFFVSDSSLQFEDIFPVLFALFANICFTIIEALLIGEWKEQITERLNKQKMNSNWVSYYLLYFYVNNNFRLTTAKVRLAENFSSYSKCNSLLIAHTRKKASTAGGTGAQSPSTAKWKWRISDQYDEDTYVM